MIGSVLARRVFATMLAAMLAWPAALSAEPWGFFLTWQRDPTTTMTVQWLDTGTALPVVDEQALEPTPFHVPHVGAIDIDAPIDQWWAQGLEVAFLGNEDNVHPEPDELSADGRVGWNDDGLVIALRVRDDTTIEYPEITQLYAGDSVEVFVSDGVGSNHRYQSLLTPGRDPAFDEPRVAFHSGGTAPDADELSVQWAARPTEQGYEIQILLPWDNLPELTPGDGADMGLQIYVNQRRVEPDAGLQEGRQRVLWYPAADSWNTPTSMHAIRLTREPGDTAGRLRLVYDADDDAIDVYAPLGMAGERVRLSTGQRQLAELTLAGAEHVAHARFELPAPPADQQWGAVTAHHDRTLAGRIELPRRYSPAEPTDIVYWPAGDADAAQRLDMHMAEIRGWDGHFLHRIELTGLEPDTEYRFRPGDSDRELGFRTMPAELDRPIRLAVGGDTRHQQRWMERTNRVAMQYEPDMILWGGDLAYADGLPERTYRWVEWFQANDNTLIHEDGRIVPIILAIGNHEVQRGYYLNHDGFEPTDDWRLRIAPFFYQLFAFPGQPGYNVLDFGDYLSIISLDTDHSNPVADQADWLDAVLAQRSDVPHVFPHYHVPGFPSHRPYGGATSARVREYWMPLFERHGIELAFENHDHTYKRTVPIRAEQPHPRGVIYIGDGAWGVGTRTVHDPAETWYLHHAESTRHAIIVTLEATHRHVLVVSEDGDVIDELPHAPARP